jgi:hypothetical protein
MIDQTTGEITSRDSLGRLTQLSKEIEALIVQAEEQDSISMSKALDQVEGQWMTKVESIGHLVKDYEHSIRDWEEERIRLDNMSKALKLRIEWLKSYLMYNMQVKGEDKLQFALVTVVIRNNPPSVGITDEKEIPSSYTRIIQEIKINKAEILKELKAGKQVPGTTLITEVKRLEIK